MASSFVFDYDGVLVDSREAVRIAYSLIGVSMPLTAWGMPWQQWLPEIVGSYAEAERLHTLKNGVYASMIHLVSRLPLYDWAIKTGSPIITGASEKAVRSMDPLCLLNVVGFEMTRDAKVSHLYRQKEIGYFVDDDESIRHEVNKRTKWSAITPQQALTLLSSQPAPTRG